MSSKIDYPTWVASKLPDVTYAPDAGGVWRYWGVLQVGEEKRDGDEYFNGVSWTRTLAIGYVVGKLQYRRPIPRPTERLLEALEDNGTWYHPDNRSGKWTRDHDTAIGYLTACESSCQAEQACHDDEAGDTKPDSIGISDLDPAFPEKDEAPESMAIARARIASLQQQVRDLERRHENQKSWLAEFFQCLDGLGVTVGVEKCRDHKQIRTIVTDLQQQVAGLTEQRDNLFTAYQRATADALDAVSRAATAEAERDRLREALVEVRKGHFTLQVRDMIDAALSPAESGVRE